MTDIAVHMLVTQSPVTEVNVVEQIIIDDRQHKNTKRPEPEGAPGVYILLRAHIIEIVVPLEERDQASNLFIPPYTTL